MNTNNMTEFQKQAISGVEDILSRADIPEKIAFIERPVVDRGYVRRAISALIPSTKKKSSVRRELAETFAYCEFYFRGRLFQIFIYRTDAEIVRDGVEFLLDRLDYGSDEMLISHLKERLEAALANEEFEGNVRSATRREAITLIVILGTIVAIAIALIVFLARSMVVSTSRF